MSKKMNDKILNEVNTLIDKKIEESMDLEKEPKDLFESITMSVVHRSREAKIAAAKAAIAVAIAKQKGDPLYAKLVKHRKLWKQYKNEIVNKYGPVAYQKWVQNQSK